MKMKTQMAVAAVMAMGLMSAGAMAAGNSGKVTFHGEVVDTPCNLEPGQDGTDVKVEFGQLSMSQLNAGVNTTEQFTLKLKNCALAGKTASIVFNSTDVNTTTPTLLNTNGSAKGLGIGIDGYTFGTEKDLKGLTDGKNDLNFTAVAQKLGADAVTAGDFKSIANFTINYK
ncbi:type 1 fimbrial protein [Salmonella enterica]|nr:type 1 fimbrial protein [Salmonella enterica]ECU0035100.1 type 1 fimbrial protein [Salmonella enterica subsp. enterica serovar Eastbourne]EAR4614452.1 type 1 fimbrial protein [Salmonella enterica]EAR7815366.1 type 1 fimbrial protein [Salmonella enterica]EDH3357141.1 fimbrial protein [Salmonella enterica]